MKGLKIVGFVLGALVVLGGIALGLALTPSVQTWAVRRAVAGQPGMTIEVTRVAAGFSQADITGLSYRQDGIVVTASAVSARYSAWEFLRKKRLNVESIAVQDLLVDLRAKPAANQSPAATATSAPAPAKTSAATPAKKENGGSFQGLLQEVQLPFELRVASLSAKGRALLSAEQSVAFELSGKGIATGATGRLDWTVDFGDTTPDTAFKSLRATGGASIALTNDRRIDSVTVDSIATATGPKLPSEQIKIAAGASQVPGGGREAYSASVGLVRGGGLETLLKTEAQFASATQEIAGTWEIALRTEQLAALLAGLGLPEIGANGSGKFNLKPATGAVAASGNLQGRVAQLQKLSPALETVGAVQFKATFDGGAADQVARLDQLELEVTGADGKKFAEIRTLQKVSYGLADQKVSLANPTGELARVALQQVPLAWAQAVAKPMVIESGDLSLVLAVNAEPDGSRVRVRAVEPLSVRALSVRDGQKKLIDRLTLSVRPSIDYSATRVTAQLDELNVTLPAGDAVTGKLSADVTDLAKTPVIAFTAQVQAKVVDALKPYLPLNPGPLAINANVDGRKEGDVVTLAKAGAVVNNDKGALLTSLELQQALRVDLKTMAVAVPNASATTARVKLGTVPLAWAESFVEKSKFGGEISGGTLDVVMRSVDDLTLTTAEALTVRGVSATLDGKPQLQNVDLSANLTATKRGDAFAYDVRRVEVKQANVVLAAVAVAGEAKPAAKPGDKLVASAKGNLEADLGAIMRQPVFGPAATLTQGKVAGVFDAAIADAIQATAVLSARGLVAKQDNRALGDLELKLNAAIKSDGSGTLALPVTLTSAARKSDVTINGVFGKGADKTTLLFTGKIASEQLFVDDFQPLGGLVPASDEKPKTPAPAKPGRDTVPFWKGVNGKVEVDLKRVLYGKDYVISGIRGTAVITDNRLSLDGLEGKFKDNPFKVAAGVNFNASQPQPYSLAGSADVTNFDVGAFLRAANPNEKPALETKATVTARFNGNGGNVSELGKNAFGKFEVSGTEGTMRLLAKKGGAGTAVNLASFGLAVLGATRNSDTASALSEITRLFNEVPFDTVKMQVERAPDLSFKLTSLEVVSPMLRMTGSGAVASKSVDDLQNAPMNIVLQLGAKDQLGYLLQRVGMLGESKDERGYQLMTKQFSVGGTPSKPDSGVLWRILGEAAAGALLR